MKKKINNFKLDLSPNYSKRIKKVKYIIIHYTGMDNLLETINLFKNPASKVSCHWLISRRGVLHKIVEEYNIAWHAGVSFWKYDTNLNDKSIGIELENKGHGNQYKPFSKSQLLTLEKLIFVLLKKYKLKYTNVLGHSDIAPDRKLDPGELFNWEYFAKKKLVYWPSPGKYYNKDILLQLGMKNKEVIYIKSKLKKIGYYCTNNSSYDLILKHTVEAFQRRFLPERVNGIVDSRVYQRILEVAKNA
tara:strand:+ start:98 stop:835 length:738 start_codon:yes stop_codon:yes gene_type:complete